MVDPGISKPNPPKIQTGGGRMLDAPVLDPPLVIIVIDQVLPYIRLFRRQFFPVNSTLKPCIKSMQVNISQNPNEIFNLPDLQDCVKFT